MSASSIRTTLPVHAFLQQVSVPSPQSFRALKMDTGAEQNMKPVLDLCPIPAQTHCSGPDTWLLGSSTNSPVGITFLDCSLVPLILPGGFLAILPLRSLPAPPDKPVTSCTLPMNTAKHKYGTEGRKCVHGGYERLQPKSSHLDIHSYLTTPTEIAGAHAYLCACPLPNTQITQSFRGTGHKSTST